jgi:hypothetical protein
VSVIGLLVVDAVHKNKELYWIISDFPLFYVCPAIKSVLLLGALHLLMLSAGTSISLEHKMLPLIIFYYKHDAFLFVRYQFTQQRYVRIFFFLFLTSKHFMISAIVIIIIVKALIALYCLLC